MTFTGWGCVAMNGRHVDFLLQQLSVLVVDDNAFTRKVVRSLLNNIGVKKVDEAPDGIVGLEQIRALYPDVVILDWEMPLLNGPEFVRIVRSPGVFPLPDVPIIMLSSHGERRRIVEAVPVSAKTLAGRLTAILAKPRVSVRLGDYYGPEPRKLVITDEPSEESERVVIAV